MYVHHEFEVKNRNLPRIAADNSDRNTADCMNKFEWDEEKNQHNIKNHSIRFEDARKIFDGPVLTHLDNRNDYGEVREISLGLFNAMVVLLVVHTDREGTTRLISARKANTT